MEKISIETSDRQTTQPGQTTRGGFPDLAHPEFNKLWSTNKNGFGIHDGFHISNGLTSDWLDKMEKGADGMTKGEQELLRATNELKRQVGTGKFPALLEQVDNCPPLRISNLAESGKLGEMFDPKSNGSIQSKDVIAVISDPSKSEQEHVIALTLMQHFFAGKDLSETVPISKIQADTKNGKSW